MSVNTATTYQIVFGREIDILNRKVSNVDLDLFIQAEVLPRFDSFTVTHCVGYWKGKPEDVCVITIVSDDYYDGISINKIAETYKKKFYQDAVLVNTFSCFPNLV